MAKFAPPHPSTYELRERYPQEKHQFERILVMRHLVSQALGGAGLLVVVGPCGLTSEAIRQGVIADEAARLGELTEIDPDHPMLYRAPDWKPRTRAEDWHGLITTEPELAYQTLAELSGQHANIATEINTDPKHQERNSQFLTLAWKGGRNGAEKELTEALALHDPTLPIAIKNSLDGEIDMALGDVEKIEHLRGGMGARAILLYRGGLNAQDPKSWEDHYRRAFARTNGRLLVDVAHGAEQAHDPTGRFQKSIEGQQAALDHLVAIAEKTGEIPAGIFIEASDHPGRTDPNMPFEDALEGAAQLIALKKSLQGSLRHQ